MDATLALTVRGSDDFGLQKIGLFVHRVGLIGENAEGGNASNANNANEAQWQAVQTWSVDDHRKEFEQEHSLPVTAMNAIEGERLSLAVRAIDTSPQCAGQWVTGPVYQLTIGGHGAELQRMYAAHPRHRKSACQTHRRSGCACRSIPARGAQLSPDSGMRWDDQKNLDALAKGTRTLADKQAALREQTGKIARGMVMDVSHLQRSLGMLADTEMVRSRRILEAVAERDTPSDKRAAVSDAQVTQERTVKSLQKMLDEYRQFRRDWELANMVALLQMLGERQERMSQTSREYANNGAGGGAGDMGDRLRTSMLRRQEKVHELVGLSQTAFEGMATRTDAVGEVMAKAFGQAAKTLASEKVLAPLKQAEQVLQRSDWSATAEVQHDAAAALLAIHAQIKQAKADAARELMEKVKEQKSELEKQGDVEDLMAGYNQSMLNINEDELTIEDITHLRKIDKAQKEQLADAQQQEVIESQLAKVKNPQLVFPDDGQRQEFDKLSLSNKPGKPQWFKDLPKTDPNAVTPYVQEKFEDLVGDLVEQTERMTREFQTMNLNRASTNNEPGDVTAGAHELNSTAASAATGNQKPPEQNIGGALRIGRQGARAHGTVVGDEAINRRGRDRAQDGQFRVPDQKGQLQEKMSDDPQTDQSTGLGGKSVNSKRPNAFSRHDTEEWTNEALKQMEAPKDKRLLVERSTGEIDPAAAEKLRDLTSQQEQVVERVKKLRKELDKMYLPTDRLDDILDKLKANLEKLKHKPDAEAFREQQATLAELRSVAMVFNRAASNFQPSVRREQRVRGRILDEPAAEPIPGYDEAVKRYYEKLANP